jgi:trehalose 6-phosphate phosphatase
MKNILAKTHASTLANFACSSVLIGFDYDGTLAPVASTPSRARMRASTRALLERVARQYPCVVISGRPLDDVAKRLQELPLWHVFGNHGLEPWAQTEEAADLVSGWVSRLEPKLKGMSGVVVENKKYSVTVHYRHADDKARVRSAIAAATRGLRNVRAVGGDHAVNLMVQDGTNKGVALQRARRVLACDTAIYVGDDETDEDVFASAPPEQLLSVRVGASRGTRARYHLTSQAAIDRFLRALLNARARRPASAARAVRRRTPTSVRS